MSEGPVLHELDSELSRQCEELFGYGHDQWDKRYSCYAANRRLFFDKEEEIYSGVVPPGVEEMRIDFYARADSYRRRHWERSRVVIQLTQDVTRVDVSVELLAGPRGEQARSPGVLRTHVERPSGATPKGGQATPLLG